MDAFLIEIQSDELEDYRPSQEDWAEYCMYLEVLERRESETFVSLNAELDQFGNVVQAELAIETLESQVIEIRGGVLRV